MYKYIYISTSDLSIEELSYLAGFIRNRHVSHIERANGYILYLKSRNTHFYVRENGLHTNLDDHLKVYSYEEYIQHVFENQLEN